MNPLSKFPSTPSPQSPQPFVMPYALLGYPNLEKSLELVQTFVDAGVNRIELGLPFSDPMADGQVLQAANHMAHQHGYSLETLVEALEPITRKNPQIIFTAMTYLNVLGIVPQVLDSNLKLLSKCFSSIVIPDFPLEAYPKYAHFFKDNHLAIVPLIAPNTSEDRIESYCAGASDFIYLVTATGVTGGQVGSPDHLIRQVARIKKSSDLPIIAGFGIKTMEDVFNLGGIVDGAIMASAIITRYDALEKANMPIRYADLVL